MKTSFIHGVAARSLLLVLRQILISALLFNTASVMAGVVFDRAANTLRVTGYPESNPCRPETLLRVDRMNNWGIVTYNQSNGDYRVDADLQVGWNDGSRTYFQLGDKDNRAETMVVNGNVIVYPFRIKGENPRDAAHCVNRLTLGVPGAPAARAVLKIESAPDKRHGLYVRECPALAAGGKKFSRHAAQGGQLHVYNSRITAAREDAKHAFAGGLLYGESVVLSNAVIAWFNGVATYGLHRDCSIVAQTVFEHGGSAMINYGWVARGCVFRDLQSAVRDWGGPIHAELYDCLFEGNRQNLRLTIAGSVVNAVDCEFGRGTLPDLIRNERQTREGRGLPALVSHRHVRMAVTDEDRRPIQNARVVCRLLADDHDLNAITRWEGVTDAAGMTPGRGDAGAVVLAEYRVRAAENTNAPPERTDFEYEINVQADGYAPATPKLFKPVSSWMKVDMRLVAINRDAGKFNHGHEEENDR